MSEHDQPQHLADLDEGDAQLFHPGLNVVARASIFLVLLLVVVLVLALRGYVTSNYVNEVMVRVEQPVPFSHAHHVDGLGIDCRYCHASVEVSAVAEVPPTHTCMTCHSQVWNDSPLLEPVRESYRTSTPILWNRVHDLPDFAYFNHSIHVNKGVGCATCHGPVDEMALTYQAEPLTMGWCLECHRDPAQFLRPQEEIFNMDWQLPEDEQRALGQQLIEEYDIDTAYMTECYVCHR
jgi:hypothetical protein